LNSVGRSRLMQEEAYQIARTRLATLPLLLVDFHAFSRDPQFASAMISAILERRRHERFHVLENVGCWLEKRLPGLSKRLIVGAWVPGAAFTKPGTTS